MTQFRTPDVEPMACGVCAEPLFPGQSGGEIVVWLHRSDLVTVWPENREIPPERLAEVRAQLGIEGADHIAVPVPIADVHTATICDFCSQPNPGWILPVEEFAANDQQAFNKDWAICEPCARLIKKGRWEKVLQRALDTASAKYGVNPREPLLVERQKALLAQVREYQSGPVRRA